MLFDIAPVVNHLHHRRRRNDVDPVNQRRSRQSKSTGLGSQRPRHQDNVTDAPITVDQTEVPSERTLNPIKAQLAKSIRLSLR